MRVARSTRHGYVMLEAARDQIAKKKPQAGEESDSRGGEMHLNYSCIIATHGSASQA